MRRAFAAPKRWVGLLCALALSAASVPLWADELGGWYSSDTRAGAYASARFTLQSVYAEGSRLHIPLGLLTEKLREGASKGVTQDRLVGCLRAELGRLEQAKRVLDVAVAPRTMKGDLDDEVPLKAVGIYLRGGVPEPVISGILGAGSRSHEGMEAALSACEAIMELRGEASIADDDSLQIGKLLLASSLEPGSYAVLAPVYARAKTGGLSDASIVKDVIIATLASGGGADAMNDRIARAQRPSVYADPLAVEAGMGSPSQQRSVSAASTTTPGGPRPGSAQSSAGVPAAAGKPQTGRRPQAAAAPMLTVSHGGNPGGSGAQGSPSQGAAPAAAATPAAASAAGAGPAGASAAGPSPTAGPGPAGAAAAPAGHTTGASR